MKRTVIVQGPTNHPINGGRWPAQTVIDSIRAWFDGELIFSTWKTEDLTGINDVDHVVLSEDPGPGPDLSPNKSNLRRQLVGMQAGLKKSSGDLVFKIRSDTAVHADIFEHFDNSSTTLGELSMFSKRITVANIMTINPDTQREASPLFRVSDWMHLGLKLDLQKYCDIINEVDASNFKNSGLCPESLWFTTALKKYAIHNFNQFNLEEHRDIVWKAFVSNFKVVNTISTAKVYNLAKWMMQPEDLYCYMTESQYNTKLQELI